jgi:hypothetical protein
MKAVTCVAVTALVLVVMATTVSAAAAPAAPTEESIKKLKVKGLKAFLSDRGLKCSDCQEKSDFVAMAVKNLAVAILPSKVKIPMPEGEFWEVWSNVAKDMCVATATQKAVDEKTAKKICGVVAMGVENVFMMQGKRTANKLKKKPAAMLKTSFGDVYQQAGRRLLSKVVSFCFANAGKCKSATAVEKLLSKDDGIKGVQIIKYLTNVGVENTNTMYEAMADKNLDDEL